MKAEMVPPDSCMAYTVDEEARWRGKSRENMLGKWAFWLLWKRRISNENT